MVTAALGSSAVPEVRMQSALVEAKFAALGIVEVPYTWFKSKHM